MDMYTLKIKVLAFHRITYHVQYRLALVNGNAEFTVYIRSDNILVRICFNSGVYPHNNGSFGLQLSRGAHDLF